LERFQRVLALGVERILVEKPVEQSRARARALIAAGEKASVWSNHYRRALAAYAPLRGRGPFVITVTSGAIGLGCNGIHWIDFALYLTASDTGALLFGEIDSTPIRSGRGPQFLDYGGRGLFSFPDGSRLFLSSAAASSAPTALSIVGATTHWVVDQDADSAHVHERDPRSTKPNYLYGADYAHRVVSGMESFELWTATRDWADALAKGREPPQPRLSEAAPAYELLFDLLERGGETAFHFT
jgi:hypothetical protein